MSPEIFFTPDEIAYEWRCSVEFIRREVRKGKFKKVHIIGGKLLIPQKSKDKYFEDHAIGHHG